MHKFIKYLISINILIFGLINISSAETVLNTGNSYPGLGWALADWQYFAMEFQVDQTQTITSIEAFLDNNKGLDGNMTIALASDDGSLNPGAVLYSDNVLVPSGSVYAWYGVSHESWQIAAGSYWLEFIPDHNISGTMLGDGVSSPLDRYIQANNAGWEGFNASYLHLSVDIENNIPSVPEPTSFNLLIIGLLVLGLKPRRFF